MSKENEPNIEAEKAEESKQSKKAEKAEKLKAQLLEAEERAAKAEAELAAQADKYLRVAAEYGINKKDIIFT